MSDSRILIVGGGLCGLACAITAKMAGYEAVVFERMPEFQEIGAGIQLPPNATRLLRAWGVLDAARAASSQPQHVSVRTGSGALLTDIPVGGRELEERHGAPYLLIHRADLHRILLARARELGADVRLGAAVAHVDLSADGPWLRLAGGGEPHRGALVVGADGERSACRDILLGRSEELASAGDIIYRAAVPVSQVMAAAAEHDPPGAAGSLLGDLAGLPSVNYWMGPDAHAVSYVTSADGLLNIVFTAPQTDDTTYGMQPVALDELLDRFRGWDEGLLRAVRMAPTITKWTLLQASENDEWSDERGRMLLTGDAAHAMMPYLAQGAAQAFEDAAAFGGLLSRHGDISKDSMLAVVRDYERLRKDRIVKVRGQSKAMRGVFGMPAGEGQRQRDNEFKKGVYVGSTVRLPDPAFQNWLWSGVPEGEAGLHG